MSKGMWCENKIFTRNCVPAQNAEASERLQVVERHDGYDSNKKSNQ